MPRQRTFANPARKEKYNYGLRLDGTPKGAGWLGEIPHVSGKTMTEFSVGVEIDGKETLIPSIVPSLSKDEISILQRLAPDQRVPGSIIEKATQHAIERIKQGKSPFKD